ncbi:MAG TPA: GPW/gp25 family protein [Candidatus Dormibacteraeota bacterium]
MSAPISRALAFGHPDLARAGQPPGLGVTAQGGLASVEGEESVRQAILLLLTTTPGERVMRPEYGCDLHRLAFAPNDATTAGLAIHFVRRAIERFEPRVEVSRVDAGADPDDPARLDIWLEYRVRSTQRTDAITLSVDLGGVP